MSGKLPMVLGTVQLGLAYGIRGLAEAPDQVACDSILTTAWQAGVRSLDTASAYGASEDRIGHFLAKNPKVNFEITTKLGPQVRTSSESAVIDAVEQSMTQLRRPIESLLLHRPEQLNDWNKGLRNALVECRSRGWIRRIGVSIYSVDDLERTFDFEELSEIQLPCNVFDQRFLRNELPARARDAGKRLAIRSVFLQGLLLMTEVEAASKQPSASEWIGKWERCSRDLQREQGELALQFVLASLPAAQLVIGCDSPEHVVANVDLFGRRPLGAAELSVIKDLFSDVPAEISDPRRWLRA